MKNKSNQKGITLIALVITIIILLILAGISISALTNTGLFEKTEEAKYKTENAQVEENAIVDEYEDTINGYLTGGTSGGSNLTNVDTSNTNPEAAMPSGATVLENDASKGIVIKDSKDNEWVWVEVPKTTVFTTATSDSDYDSIKTDLIAYATDYRKGSSSQSYDWTDEYYEGCGVEATETKTAEEVYTEMYNKMLSSVYTNGGFWISRYEIGDATSTESNTTRTSSSGTTGTAVSQANQIPYNYVTCSQAQTLASGMSTDTSKTSSLLFGIQWDLVCKFLEVKGDWNTTTYITASYYIKKNSKSWGNYSDSSLTLNRGKYIIIPSDSTSVWTEYTKDTENYVTSSQTSSGTSYSLLLTTGASEETNKMNIYDFAGNAWEWTLEKTSYASTRCAHRGGYFGGAGSYRPASDRYLKSISYSDCIISFRATLW